LTSAGRTRRKLKKSEALGIGLGAYALILTRLPDRWTLPLPNNPILATQGLWFICDLVAVAVIISAIRDYGGLRPGVDDILETFEERFLLAYPTSCGLYVVFTSIAANVPFVFFHFQEFFIPLIFGLFTLASRAEFVPLLRGDYIAVVHGYRWLQEKTEDLVSYLLG